jgi:hypothetical protein
MKKSLIVIVGLLTAAHAYVDTDLDGVDDTLDRCPGTPMTELVDANGCPVASLASSHRFDLIAGVSYQEGSRTNVVREGEDTTALSLQADYYYKNYSLQLMTGLYDASSSSGMNDTLLAGYYRFSPADAVTARVGVGVIFPTYDTGLGNEAVDYQASAGLSYALGNGADLFGGFSYTLVNDDDVYGVADIGDIIYQNTAAFTVGAGYGITPKFYGSLSYYRSDSIYDGTEAIESVSLYGIYAIDASLFATVSYAKGLSDSASDNAVALRIGRYF